MYCNIGYSSLLADVSCWDRLLYYSSASLMQEANESSSHGVVDHLISIVLIKINRFIYVLYWELDLIQAATIHIVNYHSLLLVNIYMGRELEEEV